MELEVGVKSWEPKGSGTEVVVGEGEIAKKRKYKLKNIFI